MTIKCAAYTERFNLPKCERIKHMHYTDWSTQCSQSLLGRDKTSCWMHQYFEVQGADSKRSHIQNHFTAGCRRCALHLRQNKLVQARPSMFGGRCCVTIDNEQNLFSIKSNKLSFVYQWCSIRRHASELKLLFVERRGRQKKMKPVALPQWKLSHVCRSKSKNSTN